MLARFKAPEIHSDHWLNSKPLTLEGLKGKVVMVDFWTFSCINCVRTLPHMEHLWEKYKDKGFVLIGVHTPEFDFEKDPKNVEEAIKRYGLQYPICMDNDYVIWNAFGNEYWPRQYFIDKDGFVRHDHIGDGGERAIERWITQLLNEAGATVQFEEGEDTMIRAGDITPETYLGELRNRGLGTGSICLLDGKCVYRDVVRQHEPGVVYLDGHWHQEDEYIRHEDDKEAYVLLKYRAREVNVVMSSPQKTEVDVLLDGKPLDSQLAGRDVSFGNGRSFLPVERADMYRVINMKGVEEHEIKLVSRTENLRVYVFTFG